MPCGINNRRIAVRSLTMVDFHLLQTTGTSSGPTQLLIQLLPSTLIPGLQPPRREGNTISPKLPVSAATCPLSQTSPRPTAELNKGINLPSHLMKEYNLSILEAMIKMLYLFHIANYVASHSSGRAV
jgi:hypothetical protein